MCSSSSPVGSSCTAPAWPGHLKTARTGPSAAEASNTGVIMVAGQKVAFGRIHARQVVTVHVADRTLTSELGDDARTVARTTTTPVRSYKADDPEAAL